ncbi:MAG: glycosyltransferase [Candidatus Omnitrophota bacterium]|jgi:glycosyltransferase involved in cell wall biosynthesis
MLNKSISLVFPMYNEKECLPRAVGAAEQVLAALTNDYEIIIVDDASTDGSGQFAEGLAKANKKIKVVHHSKNRKLGAALKTGFSSAGKEIIVYTDMDLPFDLAQLKDILRLADAYDIVTGARIGNRESCLRVVYSKVYNNLINFIFRVKVKDINFALKIFKRKILSEMQLKSEGSFISAEFLAKARKLGLSIKEVNTEYKLRTHGISRLSTPSVICKILYEMIRFYPEIALFSRKRAAYSRIKKAYGRMPLWARVYNFGRFNTCPFDRIEKFIPREGDILDIGCGTALLLNLLALDHKGRLVGFDADKKKAGIAKESAAGKNIKIEIKDINSDIVLPRARCVTIIDVLSYLDAFGKKKLLKKVYDSLEPDGVLIIKDIDKKLSFKYFFTFLQECLAVRILGLTFAKGLYFTSRRTYLRLLDESKFFARAFDIGKGYLYPHILYVCHK